MEKDTLNERASRIIYYLGKGLWKSIPVLGPIVDELYYENFKQQFLGGVDHLSEKDLMKIVELIPESISNDDLEAAVSGLSDDIKDFVEQQIKAINFSLVNIEREIKVVNEHLERSPILEEILIEINEKMNQSNEKQLLLEMIENKRDEWINRISSNQVTLLRNIPDVYTPINDIWRICIKIIPSCVYKEFRFRLHELEWLGLVERYAKGYGDSMIWIYRKTEKGCERVRDNG